MPVDEFIINACSWPCLAPICAKRDALAEHGLVALQGPAAAQQYERRPPELLCAFGLTVNLAGVACTSMVWLQEKVGNRMNKGGQGGSQLHGLTINGGAAFGHRIRQFVETGPVLVY